MATVNFTIKHRPVRIGLLVRPGEVSDFQKATALCSLLWGGLFNPIIPVASETDEVADFMVRAFQIDVLVAVAQSDAIDKFVKRYPALRNPRMSGKNILSEDWHSKKRVVVYLDVLNAIDKYWQQEFKHAAAGTDSECRLVTWDVSDPLHLLLGARFGAYDPSLNLKYDFRQGFLKGLRATEVPIGSGDPIPPDLTRKITPMTLAGSDLQGQSSSFRTWSGGLYFGLATDVIDLTAFWNIRAAGSAVEFVCLSASERTKAFAQAHIDYLDNLPPRHPTVTEHIAVFSRNAAEEVTEALKATPLKKPILLYQLPPAGNELGVTPVMFGFDWEFGLGFVEKDAGSYSVTLTLPERKFLADAQSREDQQLAVSIEPHGDYGHPGFTLEPPFRPSLTEFYSREIHRDPWSVRTEREGIGLIISTHDRTLHLQPIKHSAIVAALFGEAGLKIEPSQGGRLADRLADALGGYEGARVFKIRGVRNLIAKFSSQDAVGRGDATNEIWNNGQFEDHEQLHIEARETPKLTTYATFDFLLKHGFYRAGLEFKCDNCGLISWLSLRQVDDQWICEFCGHSNMTSLHVRDRGDWKFRKSGLLAKDNNQEGAIPVLLSLLTLGRIFDRDNLLRLTSVNVTGGVSPCEIDFVALYHHQGKISCAIGEAKAAGGVIDPKDVENLKAVADALKKSGIDPYLVFAKTADTFRSQEIDLFRAARQDGYDVILLANAEIEPYHPYYEDSDEKKLPFPYAATFDEMVANAASRYLP